MDIVVDDSGTRIADPDILTAFSVVSTLPLADLDAALRTAGLGHVHDGHAWIASERLQVEASALATAPDWLQRYRAMLAYAESKGWWEPEHALVRAHVRNG